MVFPFRLENGLVLKSRGISNKRLRSEGKTKQSRLVETTEPARSWLLSGFVRSKLFAMEPNLKDVFREAAQLPERDRAALAGLLIETLDPISEPDVEAAWSEEIKRRVAEIDAGRVELIPWEEVRAELFGLSNES